MKCIVVNKLLGDKKNVAMNATKSRASENTCICTLDGIYVTLHFGHTGLWQPGNKNSAQTLYKKWGGQTHFEKWGGHFPTSSTLLPLFVNSVYSFSQMSNHGTACIKSICSRLSAWTLRLFESHSRVRAWFKFCSPMGAPGGWLAQCSLSIWN